MVLRLISPPLERDDKLEVVSIEEVKAQARISHDTEDDLIQDDIEAAYDYLAGPNGWLGHCALLTQDFEEIIDRPIRASFELSMRPLVGDITSFELLGSDGTTYDDVPEADWSLWETEFPTIYRLASSEWPYSGFRRSAGIYRIRYSAGYGTEKENIPSPIRKGIKLLVAHWFKQREATGEEGRSVGGEIEYGLRRLCGRYRIANDPS
jgi:uncharacterized phiE125 gp8 family phage protein